ncbi:MAG: adenylyl-sulfate kinase [Proteobacteria bacterium]|nr:adenylyl-sulfate kinase [Pseudomonadota bacterium]
MRRHYTRVVIGGIVWFTGLSGAGKSTLANAVAAAIHAATARPLEVLDGDDIRTFLSAGLTFTRADRDTNVRRIAYVARLLAKHGTLVFVAAIAPYAETRAEIRAASVAAGHRFVEIFVDASLETVTARDVKGLYKRALAGEIPHFTGVSDPYEAPTAPELAVPSDREALDASTARVVALLRELALVAEQ